MVLCSARFRSPFPVCTVAIRLPLSQAQLRQNDRFEPLTLRRSTTSTPGLEGLANGAGKNIKKANLNQHV